MNTISASAADLSEHFDSETFELLEAVVDGIEIPEFEVDLDIAFGTPLEMYEFVTPGELARFDAAAGPRGGRTKAQDEVGFEFAARRDAARDIVAADPSITELVRERLVDALIPHAAQLRIAPPAAASLPIAA
ncbi:hypothetical protein [Streptomyces sp. NPDC020597]|uniref:hypothetical protein n=1 Tax=unclassified Streptomyces TaxID=2593676 RepID=UPI0037BE1C59